MGNKKSHRETFKIIPTKTIIHEKCVSKKYIKFIEGFINIKLAPYQITMLEIHACSTCPVAVCDNRKFDSSGTFNGEDILLNIARSYGRRGIPTNTMKSLVDAIQRTPNVNVLRDR